MDLIKKVLATLGVLGLLAAFQLEAPSYVIWALTVVVLLLILWPPEKAKK